MIPLSKIFIAMKKGQNQQEEKKKMDLAKKPLKKKPKLTKHVHTPYVPALFQPCLSEVWRGLWSNKIQYSLCNPVCDIDPKAKGKGILIKTAEKMSKYMPIYASMIQVDESEKERMAMLGWISEMLSTWLCWLMNEE